MAKPYVILSEIEDTLTSEFVHGTDNHCHLVSAADFDAGGGFVRIETVAGDHWCLYEYTGITTNDLTGLTPCTLGNVESDVAYTFPAGAIVFRVVAPEDVAERIMGPASATDGAFMVFDGTSGKKAKDAAGKLGGNMDVNGNSIVSASNGNIPITPNGTGQTIISAPSDIVTVKTASTVVKAASVVIAVGGDAETYTLSAGTWTNQPTVGERIYVTGFTESANNGVKTVTVASTTVITVAENLTTEAEGDSITIVAALTTAEAGTVLVSAAGAYTLYLPPCSGNAGLRFHFVKTDANYNLITLSGNGTETFNYENSTGAPVTTYPRLNTYCAEVTVVSDGTNWQCINERIGQVPECWAYLSADQLNLAQGVFTLVALDSEVYDIGGNFNTGTNRFVVPVPGKYQVLGEAAWLGATVVAGKLYDVAIYVDGAAVGYSNAHSSVVDYINNAITLIVNGAINNYIQLYVCSFAGVDTVDLDGGSGSVTRMIIRLISKA